MEFKILMMGLAWLALLLLTLLGLLLWLLSLAWTLLRLLLVLLLRLLPLAWLLLRLLGIVFIALVLTCLLKGSNLHICCACVAMISPMKQGAVLLHQRI